MQSTRTQAVLQTMHRNGKLSPEAVRNIEAWLRDASLANFALDIKGSVARGAWTDFEDAFYKHTIIGTGGLRGSLGPEATRDALHAGGVVHGQIPARHGGVQITGDRVVLCFPNR